MKVNSFYPVILTEQVAASSAFYIEHFGFDPVFKADWYVSLKNNHSIPPLSWPFWIPHTLRFLLASVKIRMALF